MLNVVNVEIDMKKEYIKPEIEIVVLELITMLAISSEGGLDVKDDEIDYDNGGSELSNNRRGQWGNLWAED